MMELKNLQKESLFHAKRRGLARSPMDSLTHLSQEVDELIEAFVLQDINDIKSELADIVLVAASFAEQMGIDLKEALTEKHAFNIMRD